MKHSYEIKTIYVGHRVYKIVNGFSIRVNITKRNKQNMTREEAKEFYPILQAFAEGKAIECRTKPSALSKSWQGMNDWTEIKEIGYWDNIEYRIKPEPKYRPFKDAKECWQEMQKHQPFGWVKYANKYISISAIDSNNDYEIDFDDYTFADGTPFGIREEQL